MSNLQEEEVIKRRQNLGIPWWSSGWDSTCSPNFSFWESLSTIKDLTSFKGAPVLHRGAEAVGVMTQIQGQRDDQS